MGMIPILMAKAAYDRSHGRSHSPANEALGTLGFVFAVAFVLAIIGGVVCLILSLCGVL